MDKDSFVHWGFFISGMWRFSVEKEYLDEKQVEERYGIRLSTLRNWRHLGRGPVYHKLLGKSVRYAVADLDAFMAACRIVRGADPQTEAQNAE